MVLVMCSRCAARMLFCHIQPQCFAGISNACRANRRDDRRVSDTSDSWQSSPGHTSACAGCRSAPQLYTCVDHRAYDTGQTLTFTAVCLIHSRCYIKLLRSKCSCSEEKQEDSHQARRDSDHHITHSSARHHPVSHSHVSYLFPVILLTSNAKPHTTLSNAAYYRTAVAKVAPKWR